STHADLKEAMDEAHVDYVRAIAHPPLISKEFILKSAQTSPRILPVVNIPSGTFKAGQKLKKYVEQGAKALKIHAAADGEGPDSPRYLSLLEAASDLGIPVILHTGCLHSYLFYKSPKYGHAEIFAPWFKKFPKTNFVL